jgi:uncharacterized protein YggT (Ycf19 family)
MKNVVGKLISAGLLLVCFYVVFLPLMSCMLSLTDSDFFHSFMALIEGLIEPFVFPRESLLGQFLFTSLHAVILAAIVFFAPLYLTVRLFMFVNDVWNRFVSSNNKSD